MGARHTCSETSGLLGGRVTEETGDGQKVFFFSISYLQGHLVLLGRLLSFCNSSILSATLSMIVCIDLHQICLNICS